jgi:monoamine oxidase
VSVKTQRQVAVIGAGLAGLSSAYTLSSCCSVTVFEREDRLGGRVFTSTAPPGEHGAEYLLEDEEEIRCLVRKLRVQLQSVDNWGSYRFGGTYASGHPRAAAARLLAGGRAERVSQLLKRANSNGYPRDERPGRWVAEFLEFDAATMHFVEMLLLGEMCAPLNQLTPRQVLGSLRDSGWYRINGGASRLVDALNKATAARFCTSSEVISVRTVNRQVAVCGRCDGHSFRHYFDGAIITSPDGERLIRRKPRQFNSYVSILLKYDTAWWRREHGQLSQGLRNGLYLDTPLNFIGQVMNIPGGASVLRVLIPDARRLIHVSDAEVIALCIREVRSLSPHAPRPRSWSVQRWRLGLPAGIASRKYLQASSRIYLAGDRFGSWPSMDTAIRSGSTAANAMLQRWGLSSKSGSGKAPLIGSDGD